MSLIKELAEEIADDYLAFTGKGRSGRPFLTAEEYLAFRGQALAEAPFRGDAGRASADKSVPEEDAACGRGFMEKPEEKGSAPGQIPKGNPAGDSARNSAGAESRQRRVKQAGTGPSRGTAGPDGGEAGEGLSGEAVPGMAAFTETEEDKEARIMALMRSVEG